MSFVHHLLGENGATFSSLAGEIQGSSIELEGLEEATVWTILFLYTLILFEEKYCEYFLESSYKKYSIWVHIDEILATEGIQNALWNTLLETMDTLTKTRILPILDIYCLSKKSLSYLLSVDAISNTYLISLINHIYENIILYPSDDLHIIGSLYEILSTYSLSYKNDSLYSTIKTLGQKNTGSYYTPKQLAEYMAEYAIEKISIVESDIKEVSILDNSCGTGILLLEVLIKIMELVEKNPENFKDIFQCCETKNIYKNNSLLYIQRYFAKNILYGIDINPIAIAITRYILTVKTFIPYEECLEYKEHIKVGNALLGSSYTEVLQTLSLPEKAVLLKGREGLCLALQKSNILLQKKYIRMLAKLYTKSLLEKLYTIPSETTISEETYIIFINGIFHYELEFPERFFLNKKGFTCIIGNPPWEKIKFENTLFWEQYQSGYGACIESKKYKIRSQETEEIRKYKQLLQELSLLYSKYYKLAYCYSRGIGDDNLFRYFIERTLSNKDNKSILSKNGFLLYIVPTGLMTEESSSSLRVFCIEECSVDFFIGFENREKIFQNVDSRYKFGILCVSNQESQSKNILVSFMQTSLKSFNEYLITMVSVPKEFLHRISGTILAVPEIRSIQDIAILHRIYTTLPSLSEDYISIRRELDCSTHRDLFYEEESELANIPLYRGAMIWHYNSHYTVPRYYMSSVTVDTLLQSRELYRFFNDLYRNLPEEYKKKYRSMGKTALVLEYFGIARADCLQYITPERLHCRFALRAIARNTDERSVIASLLPKGVVYQNSLFGSIVKRYSIESNQIHCTYTPVSRQLYAIAVCNSLVYDWLLRFLTAINISKVYIHRVPFPQPRDKDLEQEPYRTLISNTLQLQMNNHKGIFNVLATEIQIEERTISLEEKIRLQIENDYIVSQLYQISALEMYHILKKDYFSVLHAKKKEYIEALLDIYK